MANKKPFNRRYKYYIINIFSRNILQSWQSSLQMAEDDKVIYNFHNGFTLERMPGKESTFIFRNKEGLITAFIEKCNDVITSCREYQDRRLPHKVLNSIARFVKDSGSRLSKEAAQALGMSIIRFGNGREIYLTSSELTSSALKPFFLNDKNVTIIVNKLKIHNLDVPKYSRDCVLDLQSAKIKRLTVGEGCRIDIDLRGNHIIKSLKVKKNYDGKLFLSHCGMKRLYIDDDARAEITYVSGEQVADIELGNNFGGNVNLKNAYLHNFKTGNNFHAGLYVNMCIFYRYIEIGDNSSSNIEMSSVFARHLQIGNGYSGHLFGSSVCSRQGIRSVYIRNNFSGYLDLSAARTVQRLEVGRGASGTVVLAACPSIRLVKFDEDFSGVANLNESGIIYVRAYKNCTGRFELSNCPNLTLIKMPAEGGYKIIGAPQPVKTETSGGYVYFNFIRRDLPSEYFSGRLKRVFLFFRNLFS